MSINFFTTFSLYACIFMLTGLCATPLSAANFPGGFLEQPSTAQARATLTQSQINGMLPTRGKFTFPSPYNTDAIRLTNADDCKGSDCVDSVGYSYWNNINNHLGEDSMLIFIGLNKSRGGAGPSLLEYNKITDEVVNRGPLFDDANPLSWATGEGWYFSATMPNSLYINSDASLLRYDVVNRSIKTVFNVADLMGSGYFIWQAHSSADDRVHSATVREKGSYAMLGCMVYFEDSAQHIYYPRQGDFDECQIDKSGNWLLIKENVDGQDGEDNRIINLKTGQERVLMDRDGAAGHSDMGYGYMIAADNWANDANSLKLWKFDADTLQGIRVYHNADWNASVPAHVSHGNAMPGTQPEQQFACGSSANYNNSAEANEVVCFGLDGADQALVVAPVMTDLNASGGSDPYTRAPKGNLDVSGNYFIWTSNMSGSRVDAFVVKVPGQLLIGPNASTNTDTDTAAPTAPAPTDTTLVWTDLINASFDDGTLSKTGGCDGCDDAGAVSQEEISSGDGYLEFIVRDIQTQRSLGLSVKQAGTGANQIDFAVAFQPGYIEVRENGIYVADTTISAGDVLRISVVADSVSYTRNGVEFYTSSTAPTYPLRAYASLLSSGTSISDAVLIIGSTGSGDDTTSNDTTTTDTTSNDTTSTDNTSTDGTSDQGIGAPAAVKWCQRKNATVANGVITKTGGCNGCDDAGAGSIQTIDSGDGYLEFSVNEIRKLRYIGLSLANRRTMAETIDFAFAVRAGRAEVREGGSYRADVAISAGDILRINVVGGEVTYAVNGNVFYTSTAMPVYPMRTYTRLLDSNSTTSDAFIAVSN